VSFGEQRVKEAARLGFKGCVLPRSSAKAVRPPDGMELIAVRDLREVWERLF
jgi:DNA repair protein RadA/Sms